MPPFYIGYTTEAKILKGYNGTVTSKRYKAIWQQERRDHPELFKTVILSSHVTDQEALQHEEFIQRFFDAPNNPMFINMAISRKGFGAAGENNPFFNKRHTEETRIKMRKPKSSVENMRKPKSKQHCINIGLSKKGVTYPLQTCSKCGTIGRGPNMTRYHFNNCKN
jgi:hypothetical protein